MGTYIHDPLWILPSCTLVYRTIVRISVRAIGYGNRTRQFKEGIRQKRERTRGIQPRNLMLAPLPIQKSFPRAEWKIRKRKRLFRHRCWYSLSSEYRSKITSRLLDQFFLSNDVLKMSSFMYSSNRRRRNVLKKHALTSNLSISPRSRPSR